MAKPRLDGAYTGGTTTGQVPHSDWPEAPLDKLPQANGGVKAVVTTHMQESIDNVEGERGIGDMGNDMFGSMNGKAAGELVKMENITAGVHVPKTDKH